MKRTRILWGLGFVAIAVLIILDIFGVTLGLPAALPLWKLTLGILLVMWIIHIVINFYLRCIFIPLTLGVILFEREIALAIGKPDGNLAPLWVFLLIGLLLTVGACLLIPKRRKWAVKTASARTMPENGSYVRYIDCSQPVAETVENRMGLCEIFFSNTDQYDGTGTLTVNNRMGRMVIYLPRDWQVVDNDLKCYLGSVEIPSQGSGKCLRLQGEVRLGSLEVQRD